MLKAFIGSSEDAKSACSENSRRHNSFNSFKINVWLLRAQSYVSHAKVTRQHLKARSTPTYLVFRIFKNCKISENCISLKALKNLKPVGEEEEEPQSSVVSNSISIGVAGELAVPFMLSSRFTNSVKHKKASSNQP